MKSQKLKDLRDSLGVTQEWLANRLGVTRQTIARWESGDVEVPQYIDLAVGQLLRSKAAFSEYLRGVMKEDGLSHRDVSERAARRGFKISPAYVSTLLLGHVTNPGVESLKALAVGLRRPEHEVFRAAGVDTGTAWHEMDKGRFADIAKLYASLSSREQKRVEILIAVLERELREALMRDA